MTSLLPDPVDPEFSVVMVTHGAWSLTEQALAALSAHTDCPFEVVVVDNDSKDETRARLSEVDNARVLLNGENRGFGPACNQGAAEAHGEQLVLLNTDAFVTQGWLEPMREALEDPAIGAVVPRYLHPDGSLQDAGPLLAQDGTVLMYGDGDDPERPCYRFRRILDYGGAACLLLRRSLFESLGGFDSRFAPAYYEDADLGMRIAERGLAVVYEPRSTVTHVRYGSGEATTAAALSEHNRRRFVERWGSQLVGRPWTFRGTSEQAVVGARDAPATPRVLIGAGAEERAASSVAGSLLRGWPRARITWAAALPADDGCDVDRLLQLGVEVLDAADYSWLGERLFHYDLVLLGENLGPGLMAALAQTQPQALQLPLSEIDPDRPISLLAVAARAGISPASHLPCSASS